MKCIGKSALVFLLTSLFLVSVPIWADVGPLREFKGGGVVAPDHQDRSIRLDSQEVIIRLKKRSYLVDVVFNLFNTGETTTEVVGFPKWVASRTSTFPTFIGFRGWVNGDQMEFKEKPDVSGAMQATWKRPTEKSIYLERNVMKQERQWLVSRATFPGHAQTLIRVTYEAPYYGKGYRQASYIYGTGSLWKGNIKKAVFIVDSSEVGGNGKISTHFEKGSELLPIRENMTLTIIPRSVVRYEIDDFKPDPEAYFRIKFNTYDYLRPAVLVKPKPMILPPGSPKPPPMPTKHPRSPFKR